ncbi:hypothetical protein JHW43_002097 [Diplocarpon mali]|nr:hypothetical protein JHW43_002097 [Diplocarpon mali]
MMPSLQKRPRVGDVTLEPVAACMQDWTGLDRTGPDWTGRWYRGMYEVSWVWRPATCDLRLRPATPTCDLRPATGYLTNEVWRDTAKVACRAAPHRPAPPRTAPYRTVPSHAQYGKKTPQHGRKRPARSCLSADLFLALGRKPATGGMEDELTLLSCVEMEMDVGWQLHQHAPPAVAWLLRAAAAVAGASRASLIHAWRKQGRKDETKLPGQRSTAWPANRALGDPTEERIPGACQPAECSDESAMLAGSESRGQEAAERERQGGEATLLAPHLDMPVAHESSRVLERPSRVGPLQMSSGVGAGAGKETINADGKEQSWGSSLPRLSRPRSRSAGREWEGVERVERVEGVEGVERVERSREWREWRERVRAAVHRAVVARGFGVLSNDIPRPETREKGWGRGPGQRARDRWWLESRPGQADRIPWAEVGREDSQHPGWRLCTATPRRGQATDGEPVASRRHHFDLHGAPTAQRAGRPITASRQIAHDDDDDDDDDDDCDYLDDFRLPAAP